MDGCVEATSWWREDTRGGGGKGRTATFGVSFCGEEGGGGDGGTGTSTAAPWIWSSKDNKAMIRSLLCAIWFKSMDMLH